VRVVDPETGNTRVEFRREGRALGGEDPEAQMSMSVASGGGGP